MWTRNLFTEMDRLFGDTAPTTGRLGLNRLEGLFEPESRSTASVRVNVQDKGGSYELDALAPGLEADAFSVKIEGRTLILSGERVLRDETENERCRVAERAVGGFSRSFTFPCDIDRDAIEAEYRSGRLRVRIPKTEKALPKTIDIAVVHD